MRYPQQQMDAYTEAKLVAQAEVQEALQGVYQIRVALGLPPKPEKGDDLTEVPADLDQNVFVGAGSAGEVDAGGGGAGRDGSFNFTPKQMVEDFYKRDPNRNIDKIYDQLLKDAPAVKQAEAKLLQAQAQLGRCEAQSALHAKCMRRSMASSRGGT